MPKDSADYISEHPPRAVRFPVMLQRWDHLTFFHWRYNPEAISGLLPSALQLDTFDGSAWIGLTPFIVRDLRPPGLPALPWISRFPEMNVRTYVRGPDGERGIWFFTLEAARLAAVLGARLSYRLPYRWARMRVRPHQDLIEYFSKRRFRQGNAELAVQIGPAIVPSDRERFLTARFRLYTRFGSHLAFAHVEHPPWPLYNATALRLEQDVIEHSGVPVPNGEPLVHYSPGVLTRIEHPTLVR